MQRLTFVHGTAVSSLLIMLLLGTARAEITYSGDVNPALPWYYGLDGFVGQTSNGTIRVDAGTHFNGGTVNIGYSSGATGEVTADGYHTYYSAAYTSVGGSGTGFLNVTGGANVSGQVSVADSSGSKGTVTISGYTSSVNGISWVGKSGNGTVNVINGGSLYGVQQIGCLTGSTGTVTVKGAGSRLMNSGFSSFLYVGGAGFGTPIGALNVVEGGLVQAPSICISGALSTLTVDSESVLRLVNFSNSFSYGAGGSIKNDGKVQFIAGTGIANSTFYPISAASWSGSGIYQAIGGTWNAADHTFTASSLQSSASNTISIDLSNVQQVSVNGGAIQAGFLAKTGTAPLTFTAAPMSGSPLATLQQLVGDSGEILSAWQVSASGSYAAGDPACLSFQCAPGYYLCYFDGNYWSTYTSNIDWYDQGGYLNLPVTNLNGSYAITTSRVPEPGTFLLLIPVAFGLVIRLWRKRKSSE